MSEEERQHFDIKAYLVYFRNFHVFLGVTLLLGSLILLYVVNSDWSGIFLGSYPILAYVFFIWKSNQFAKNVTQKQKAITYLVMGALLLLALVIVYEFTNGLKDNEIIVDHKKIEITGDYGTVINWSDLKSVTLCDALPEISSKINGFALEHIKKGYFRAAHDEKVKLLINSTQTPIILLITKEDEKIYYSSKDQSNKKLYDEVKSKMKV
jgi:hypothetical protein